MKNSRSRSHETVQSFIIYLCFEFLGLKDKSHSKLQNCNFNFVSHSLDSLVFFVGSANFSFAFVCSVISAMGMATIQYVNQGVQAVRDGRNMYR